MSIGPTHCLLSCALILSSAAAAAIRRSLPSLPSTTITMDTSKKSQILKLSLIVALLLLAPLLSTSLRPTYFYFIFNLLLVALGAEAGLLSFFSKTAEEKKISLSFQTPKQFPLSPSREIPTNLINETTVNTKESKQIKLINAVEKCSSAKILGAVKVRVIKKSPSTPSLFFIGGSDHENDSAPSAENLMVSEGDHKGEEVHEELLPSGQELFHKAETFIGNFYKQLKMQREDSLKKIHGLYHKAF